MEISIGFLAGWQDHRTEPRVWSPLLFARFNPVNNEFQLVFDSFILRFICNLSMKLTMVFWRFFLSVPLAEYVLLPWLSSFIMTPLESTLNMS